MGEMRKAYSVLDGSHQEKDHLVDWGVGERIALKLGMKKQCMKN
jgi:hypothetical protein